MAETVDQRLDRIESQQDFLLGQQLFLLWALACTLRRYDGTTQDVEDILGMVTIVREGLVGRIGPKAPTYDEASPSRRGYELFYEGLRESFRDAPPLSME